jgi:hypothetical protein
MHTVTTSLFHDTRVKKKNGKFPVKFQVTHKREHRRFGTAIDLSINEFKMLHATQSTYKGVKGDTLSKKDIKDTLLILNSIESKAVGIIKALPEFTFNAFKYKFQGKRSDHGSVYHVYAEQIQLLIKNGQIGTAEWYACSMKSLKEYKDRLEFKQVTVDFLNSYEKWLLQNKRSITTVSM